MLPVIGVSPLLIGWCQGPGQESLPHYHCLQVCAADSTAAGSALSVQRNSLVTTGARGGRRLCFCAPHRETLSAVTAVVATNAAAAVLQRNEAAALGTWAPTWSGDAVVSAT